MPNIGKKFKESTWKPKFLVVFPCMLTIIIPRLISVGILTSYMKGYIFVILFLNVGINCLCNCKFLWRDAAEAIRGCLTNIFAPTIVIEEGSTFFIKSAMVSQMMYSLSLIIFMLTTIFGGFESTSMLMPCGKTQPSMFHCFGDGGVYENYTTIRCPLQGKKLFLLLNIFIELFFPILRSGLFRFEFE